MKHFFLILFTLFFLYACSSPNRKPGTEATSGNPTQPVTPVHSTTTDSSLHGRDSARTVQSYSNTAAVDSQVRDESTLSFKQPDISVPPYSLAKIQADIGSLRSVDDSSGGNFTIALSEHAYASYSVREKFTYNMIHAEDYSQMCDILPERTSEKDRIYGQLQEFFGEYSWSERQRTFFKVHRDSVEELMKAVIETSGRAGMNFLDVIVDINAIKMIPFLIDTYHKNNSNHYLLTTLMLLMKNNHYPEFSQSSSYNKLYKREEDSYSAFIVYNKANEDLIIKRATDFFNVSSKY